MLRIYFLFLIFILLNSCATVDNYFTRHSGRVVGKKYIFPDGKFSLDLPILQDLKIRDNNKDNEETKFATFVSNDFWVTKGLYSVDILDVPSMLKSFKQENESAKEEQLKEFAKITIKNRFIETYELQKYLALTNRYEAYQIFDGRMIEKSVCAKNRIKNKLAYECIAKAVFISAAEKENVGKIFPKDYEISIKSVNELIKNKISFTLAIIAATAIYFDESHIIISSYIDDAKTHDINDVEKFIPSDNYQNFVNSIDYYNSKENIVN